MKDYMLKSEYMKVSKMLQTLNNGSNKGRKKARRIEKAILRQYDCIAYFSGKGFCTLPFPFDKRF